MRIEESFYKNIRRFLQKACTTVCVTRRERRRYESGTAPGAGGAPQSMHAKPSRAKQDKTRSSDRMQVAQLDYDVELPTESGCSEGKNVHGDNLLSPLGLPQRLSEDSHHVQVQLELRAASLLHRVSPCQGAPREGHLAIECES